MGRYQLFVIKFSTMKFTSRIIPIFVMFVFSLFTLNIHAQITVSTGQTPTWLVENVLLSGGVQVSNVTYSGNANAIGHFQTAGNPTNLGLSEGIIMSTGLVNGTPAIGSPASAHASTNNGSPGDPLLTQVAGMTTYDAAILEFDFVPLSDTIEFRYVFGSEEYHQYANSNYNDVFAFFITGPNPLGGNYTNHNIARLPGTTIPVSINNVNNGQTSAACSSGPCTNCAYFVDNCNGVSVVFNAFTVVLTAWAVVVPCQTYHIKLAIADAGDGILDSGVFLEANSFGTNAFTIDVEYTIPGNQPYAVEGCSDALVHFSIPQPLASDFVLNYIIDGTATNGVDYLLIPDSIIIPAGQTSTTLPISPIYDGIVEGTEEVWLIFTNTCGVTDTIKVNIIDYIIPTASGYGDISFCESAASQVQIGVNVNDGYAPFDYVWDNGAGGGPNPVVSPSTTTTYTVTASDICGYDATASVTVTVFPDPIVSIEADPPGICSGYSTTLTADGAVNYLWTGGGISSSTNPITISPDSTHTYTVVGTDTNGCFGIATVTIPVNPSPEIDFMGMPLEGCVPLTVNFAELSPDMDITDWQWTFGDGGTSSQQSPVYTYMQEGDYDVQLTITNSHGCVSTLTFSDYVNAWPQAVADFYTIPEIGKTYDPTITFYSNNISQYWLWDFGDSNTSNSPPPVQHTYPDVEQNYDVTLIVSNDYGCNDTITKTIPIIDDILVFPNIITPNGDGVNDILIITNADKYPNNLLQVFNRWGKKVFEQQNYDNKWDGGNLSDGTYYYIFFYLDKAHHSSLTILRE
jgi:gliding motility-associated-like protein